MIGLPRPTDKHREFLEVLENNRVTHIYARYNNNADYASMHGFWIETDKWLTWEQLSDKELNESKLLFILSNDIPDLRIYEYQKIQEIFMRDFQKVGSFGEHDVFMYTTD